MNQEPTKPLVKSLTAWGSLAGLLSVISLIRDIYATNPQLVEDTQAWLVAAGALVSQLIVLFGRWRAVSKISGIFK